MSDDTSDASDVVNSLDSMDMSSVNTSFPVLRPGPYNFQVESMEIKESKKTAGQMSLNIKLKLLQEGQDHKTGAVINAGFPLFHTILLTPVGKLTPDMIKRSLAQFMEGVLGHKNGPFKPFEQYLGQTVTARVKVDSSEQYGDQNRIDAFIKKS
jgi:hypothetical protein